MNEYQLYRNKVFWFFFLNLFILVQIEAKRGKWWGDMWVLRDFIQ